MDTSQFYDGYVDYHARSGINDRIYSLYKHIIKLGLRSRDNVLEIGCGIGTLTFLLTKKIKKGRIEALIPCLNQLSLRKKK
jgi:16S rRNA A1518/A1519 N6-dimethyltransferase RsmA/KsgA/DIM1 with predicted DNA glycosylase/AP lyase activity